MSKAKIGDFRFDDLRHSFASHYVMAGGSLPALQQILGHATLAMTMGYSHLSPSHLRDEMSRTEHAVRLVKSRDDLRATDPSLSRSQMREPREAGSSTVAANA